MRVLHVVSGLRAGGAEQQLLLLVDDPRWQVEVASLSAGGVVADRLRAAGVRVHEVPVRGRRAPAALLRLVRVVRRGRFDVVHLHLFRSLVVGALAARLGGARRVLFTEHSLNAGLVEGRPVTRGVRLLYRAAVRLLDGVVAVSPDVRRRLIGLGVPADRVVVVPNALELRPPAETGAQVRARLGLPEQARVVGVVGRLAAPKRVDVLLDAVAPLLGPEVRLLVVGDGAERPALEARAARLGVTAWTVFSGEVQDVPALLGAMDVLASPSPEETFGLAVLEARLAGLPVVYCACPGLEPFRTADPSCVLVPSETGALRKALRPLVGRPVADDAAALLAALPRPRRSPPPPALRTRYAPEAVRDSLHACYAAATLPAPIGPDR